LLVGVVSTLACFADLDSVISALFTSRILIQFVGQIGTVFYVRSRPELASRLRFRMWLYPLPALVSLAGWLFIFLTTGRWVVAYGLASLAAGVAAFLVWDRGRFASSVLPTDGEFP
jgi:hypothetical protein